MSGLSFDPYAPMLAYFATTLACLGYIDQARSRMDEALSAAHRLKHAHTLVLVLVCAVRFDWLTRSPDVHTAKILALMAEHRFPFYFGSTLAFRGRSLLALGQAQEGLALLVQGLAELRADCCVASTPMLFTWLAEAYVMLGQPEESQNCLAEAALIVAATGERFLEAELLHRLPGDLLNAAGDRSAAERHYRQAIAVAERQSAKLLQLRASTSLARLWLNQGKRTEARDLLGPIHTWFTEGFDAPDLEEAKELMDRLA
jgi:tetratricopeptide (TPR) repeat protein